GDDSKLRKRLNDERLEYVLSISPQTSVFEADTRFEVAPAKPGRDRPPSVAKPDREHTQVKALAAGLPTEAWETVTYRDRDEQEIQSRFAFVRVIAARPVTEQRLAPREEWLIIEWPEGTDEPSDYWLSNLPAESTHERLARLARLRWMIELDYKQLKGDLGLDHYERRSYLGFRHHCALVIAAHGFMTLERQHPNHQRPA
ncbi:MAG: transposase, partial [Solirubrobacteraceae bacterium]